MTQLHAHWTGKCWDNVQTKHMCQVMTIHMCVPNMCVLVRKACVVYGVETRHGNCQFLNVGVSGSTPFFIKMTPFLIKFVLCVLQY